MTELGPFRVAVPDAEIEELRARVRATRWPDPAPGGGWDYGIDVEWLRDLCAYWADGFDWRTREAALNVWPQYRLDVGGIDVHFVHVRGNGPDPLPLIATHGWPSTWFEMLGIVGPLTDPAHHGGDPADAFDLVVPSLPGYGFSAAPTEPGFGAARVADVWAELMTALGYPRFASHGGDWGSAVTSALGTRHPGRMIGLHFTMLAPPVDVALLTPEQREWWDALQQYRDREWGYVHLQRTKPQTPAVGLTDSPAGLAAWILEKWWRWSDCADDTGERDLLRAFSRDELLTNVAIYWFTRTIGPSMRMYCESFGSGAALASVGGAEPPPRDTVHEAGRAPTREAARVDVPTGVTLFRDPNGPPRELIEPWYDLRSFTTVERGGHFPALENPDALVRELRDFFRLLR